MPRESAYGVRDRVRVRRFQDERGVRVLGEVDRAGRSDDARHPEALASPAVLHHPAEVSVATKMSTSVKQGMDPRQWAARHPRRCRG
jgi:hypothetical protein